MWHLSWKLTKNFPWKHNLVDLKHGQEKAVNCPSEGRRVCAINVFFLFELFETAEMIKKIREVQRSNTIKWRQYLAAHKDLRLSVALSPRSICDVSGTAAGKEIRFPVFLTVKHE